MQKWLKKNLILSGFNLTTPNKLRKIHAQYSVIGRPYNDVKSSTEFFHSVEHSNIFSAFHKNANFHN